MKQNILHAIFFDKFNNWNEFVEENKKRIRKVAIKEVEKFRDCGDITKGFKLFVCEGCHDTKLVPFRCKGRFCPTCSVGESQKWSELLDQDLYHVIHRHVIFTIDEGLRTIFLKYHREKLLKGLMDEAAGIMLSYFKKKRIQPGIIAALHTFGSQLEFNPHVHMVVTMGGVTKDGRWETYDYLPYAMLRKYWQNAVLKLIRRVLNRREKRDVQHLLQNAYKKNADGFYVHAPKRSRTKLKGLLLYISRYMNRGPIAVNRIRMYDGETVMFTYHDKRTNTKETKIMGTKEFIGALIRHIPDEQFKMIRRYGVYSRRIKTLKKKMLEIYQEKVEKLLVNAQKLIRTKTWDKRIDEIFGENPLKCSCCGNYYEYMGMSVSQKGHLTIKYAKNKDARRYMEEEIAKIEKETFRNKQKQAKEEIFETVRFDWEKQCQLYLSKVWD